MTKSSLKPKAQVLTVYLFNVGHGDHLLLELPGGKFGIIDFNYDADINTGRENKQDPPALTYLKHLHKPKSPITISFICLSHPHRDHTKGVKKTLDWVKENQIEVERLWLYPGIDENAIEVALASSPKPRHWRLREDLKAIREFIKYWGKNPEYLIGINHG